MVIDPQANGDGPDNWPAPSHEVTWDGIIVTLPENPHKCCSGGIPVSVYPGPLPPATIRSLAGRRRGRRTSEFEYRDIRVDLHLIPRPDNDYFPFAVSVALPSRHGGTIQERHIGYIYNKSLFTIGASLLHDLARYSQDGEVRCAGFVRTYPTNETDLYLNTHNEELLGQIIQKFLESPSIPPLATRPHLPMGGPWQALSDLKVRLAIDAIDTFEEPVKPIAAITVAPAIGTIGWATITDTKTRLFLGEVHDGALLLVDERQRDPVSRLLKDAGISVARPVPVHSSSAGYGRRAVKTPPRITFVEKRRNRLLRVHTNHPNYPRIDFAQYKPTDRALWVEHPSLVPPACEYMARLGFRVETVGTPRTPWLVEGEIDLRLRIDAMPNLLG